MSKGFMSHKNSSSVWHAGKLNSK
uniref:Uncharacterized protein n=1 Tax=Rhizophora mucronata TaxID=61149 RepID=A0A2P2R286_RHIMU